MKKILTSILFLYLSINLNAQNNIEPCQYYGIEESITAKLSNFNNTNLIIDNPLSPIVFNVKINVFNNELGTNFCSRNNIPFGENQFQEIIKDLNVNYNQYNIFFKYRGNQFYGDTDGNGFLTYIEQSSDPDNNIFIRLNQMSDLCEKNVININFVDQIITPIPAITNELQHTHQDLKAVAIIGRPIIIVSLPSFFGIRALGNGSESDFKFDKNYLICHEMGHVLGLNHTFLSFKQTFNPAYPNFVSENVTRIPTDPLFNANFAGDMIEDTPAVGNFHPGRYAIQNCKAQPHQTFTSENVDINGTYLDFENILYGNFMATSVDDVGTSFDHTNCLYFNHPNTKYFFTAGQGTFMRNFILNNVPAITGNSGFNSINITQTITNVESLYQPYERIKIISDTILTSSDNGDGTAKVCRSYTEEFKFQMGFNYLFPENETPDLTSYGTNQIPHISSPSFNCPIGIIELAPGQTNLASNFGQAYTVCRGQVCNDEPFIGGLILSSPGVLDMNLTIEELNVIQVKDPELYNKLMNQRYYKVKKETASGAKTEEVFYKQ